MEPRPPTAGRLLRPYRVSSVDAEVWPEGSLEVLSQMEVERLRSRSEGRLHALLRRCILAVLNSGAYTDDTCAVLEQYRDFEVAFEQEDRGLKVVLRNAPGTAFVDGKMIRGSRELVFSVLRDVVYITHDIEQSPRFDLATSANITDAVFHVLRNARLLQPTLAPNIVVCWGGHAISRLEYDYTKEVGYELGLRALNVCTGCGPGAMKGPMKGATIGHAKQRIRDGRYLGITEPGIIAAEPPNAIVNALVIMPDIEKRLEAFVRTGHGIVVFPGGVGTAEEILYLLGVLLHPRNRDLPFPLIFTGPASSAPYFERIDAFVGATLGHEAQQRYEIVVDDPEAVARRMRDGLEEVRDFRARHGDAYHFNWRLHVEHDFQVPFDATHESMRELELSAELPVHQLAANLRRLFSGVVSGNVREETIRAIQERGPFEIRATGRLMELLDGLLADFVEQGRMKLAGSRYEPCYRLSG